MSCVRARNAGKPKGRQTLNSLPYMVATVCIHRRPHSVNRFGQATRLWLASSQEYETREYPSIITRSSLSIFTATGLLRDNYCCSDQSEVPTHSMKYSTDTPRPRIKTRITYVCACTPSPYWCNSGLGRQEQKPRVKCSPSIRRNMPMKIRVLAGKTGSGTPDQSLCGLHVVRTIYSDCFGWIDGENRADLCPNHPLP